MKGTLIRAVLFDFDGTLTEPGSIDFDAIRRALACPPGLPILEFIKGLQPEPREAARRVLYEHEIEAAAHSLPNAGAEQLIVDLKSIGLKVGIISRNSIRCIGRSLVNFRCTEAGDFDVIFAREDVAPKPDPEGILAAASRLELRVDEILVVGDFIFDIEAGKAAGAHTVYLTNEGNPDPEVPSDYQIRSLDEIPEVLGWFRPLGAGKLPNRMLDRLLKQFPAADPSLLVGPGVGEDTAAIRLRGEETLVLKSDPVTFATESIGYFAAVVNANDIATSGATPRWMLATLLFPPGTTAWAVGKVMVELQQQARRLGLIICGGHTEVTDAVRRPVVVAQIAGTVTEKQLIRKQNMREGDCILMTKAAGVEGTCVIAQEKTDLLSRKGMPKEAIEKCRRLLWDPGISVIEEACVASRSPFVSAMHDVTEGGVATALEELSIAGRHRLRVYPDKIPVLEETRKVAQLLHLQPLGLLGSGSLLICCAPAGVENLTGSVRDLGIDIVIVGEVLQEGAGLDSRNADDGEPASWPHFEVDEIARLFAQPGPGAG